MSAPAYLPLFGSDYLADTRHLTTEEHGAYLLLMIAAWRQEDCGLPNDDKKLARIVGLSARKWATIKDTILEFWTTEGGRIYQARLRKERGFADQKSESNRRSARARWDKQATENIEGASCERISERNAPQPQPQIEEPNGSPIPPTPFDVSNDPSGIEPPVRQAPPAKPSRTKRGASMAKPSDVDEQVWTDFLAMRAKMGAHVSETAIAAFRREADRVGWSLEQAISECILRNWRGFKAEWVKKDDRSPQTGRQPSASREGDGLTRALQQVRNAFPHQPPDDPARAA